jgi:diphosphomevalonate decarboxylase
VAVVNIGPKDVATSEGQKSAGSSPFFDLRVSLMPKRIVQMKKILEEKDFQAFGEMVEAEALELHAIMLTSNPSLIYWLPGTVRMMRQVKNWRSEGLQVYFTVNTGQDIHLICQKKDAKKVAALAKDVEGVKEIIINEAAKGAHVIDKDLF